MNRKQNNKKLKKNKKDLLAKRTGPKEPPKKASVLRDIVNPDSYRAIQERIKSIGELYGKTFILAVNSFMTDIFVVLTPKISPQRIIARHPTLRFP